MSEDIVDAVQPAEQRLRVLMVHNRYKNAGGEDSVFESERDLLARKGDAVETLIFDNAEVDSLSSLQVAADAVWSRTAREAITERVVSFSPQVIHFHNTFLRVSPSGYSAGRQAGAAVVQTLHNYRLLCLNALFLRDGKPCEDCLGKIIPWPGLVHRCYHDSLGHSVIPATVNVAHRLLGTFANKVDAFIALTQFGRRKFIAGGLPELKIHVKPNFVPDRGIGSHDGGYCLFVGRLSAEKGIETLIHAWDRLPPGIPLKVAGTGPMEPLLRDARGGIEYVGLRSREEIVSLMKHAAVAIVPSHAYEGFPIAIAEAFSTGLPVIASRLGSIEEILRGENSGWLFTPGDPDDLARTVREVWDRPDDRQRKGHSGRSEFEKSFSAEANYRILKQIYASAMDTVARRHLG